MSETHVIYLNDRFSLHYEECKNLFHLINDKQELSLRFCELLALKRKIQAINLAQMFDAASPDVEIIDMPGCDRMLAFSLEDVILLRDLLSGAFTMFELNHLLHESLQA